MNDNIFGKKLKELRKSKGFTQQVLAERANVDEKHLSRIENGKYFPTLNTLNRLLAALNSTIEEVGLELNRVEANKNPLYIKALQILNSAKDDNEMLLYLEALKCMQKALKMKRV